MKKGRTSFNKTWLLIVVFALLGYAFVSSPPFQTIAAGVAIFLFGMLFLEEGFQAFVGGVLEKVLEKVTNTDEQESSLRDGGHGSDAVQFPGDGHCDFHLERGI